MQWRRLNKSSLVSEKKKLRVLTEKQIFMKITNPFIVKLHYSFQTSDKLYFVFDFVNGGDLFAYMVEKNQLSEDTTIY